MNRTEIITTLKQYFREAELVCPHTYRKYGERSWQFLSTDYLHTLLIIRTQILGLPMYCNVADYTQRGLRCNKCKMVTNKKDLYISAHVLGKAGDFSVQGLTAAQARKKIIENSHKLPHKIRMEANVTWLHIDTLPQYGITEKVHLFEK